MDPFGDPVGSVFEVPGTLGQHLGSILAPLVAKADSGASFGRPFRRLWAAFGLQVCRRSDRREPQGPQTGAFAGAFRAHFDEKVNAGRAGAELPFFLRFPTTFWTARPTFRCSRRSPNEVLPFRRVLRKSLRKASILVPFQRAFW